MSRYCAIICAMSRDSIARNTKRRRPYHHGDLRAALLSAASSIVTEEGVEALTLRACARRAGVSHAAPEHHFGSLAGLLEEFAADAHERLGDAMDAAAVENGGQPLLAAGLAYIRFAAEHAQQFRVMLKVAAGSAQSTRLRDASRATRRRLENALRDAYTNQYGREPSSDSLLKKAGLAWCCVHGYATLRAEGFDSDTDLPEVTALLTELRPAVLAE